jgi:hypothetical protein
VPAIIDFLGYNPLPEADGWGGRLVRRRTTLGMTQKEGIRPANHTYLSSQSV